ncbi:hypothetical protein BDF19DRAFT_219721 [Syncephalis fuscata]|nr:hypothetical protein BDF19DRAFT_219721 [Syncephalis fuscata]
MPFINYTSPDYNEWMNSNTKQLGARLHPLGEMNIFDFFMEATGDTVEQRLRLFGIQVLLVVDVVMFCMFGRNLVIASRMVISRPCSIVSWYCLIPSALGSMILLAVISMYINSPINCRILVWIFGFSISFTMIGNSLILLQKAHLVLCRQKWILYISIPVIITQLAFPFILIYYSFIILEKEVACAVYYPQFILWYWFVINVPINVLFSTIFCHVALKQYRLFGSEAWKRLVRDKYKQCFSPQHATLFVPFLLLYMRTKLMLIHFLL